jgi:alpha-tubulin suppressor-like RCC1 family protein
MTGGGVRCWGYNAYGQLGNGTAANSDSPPANDMLTGVQAISAGFSHTCALMQNGTVQCWGFDGMGQLGDGDSSTIVSTPTHVLAPNLSDELTNVQAIAAGAYHTCALMNTGGVRCWGSNDYGQLGDGTRTSRATPSDSDALTGVQAIAAGYHHTCALMKTGSVRCWGYNYSGELGDNPMSYRPVPAPIICQ